MRVGILSYPMLFQRDGGLQIQVRETIAALNRITPCAPRHLQVELVDPTRDRLDDYELIHVFSAINGNYRVVEMASELGLPVVLSPLLSPGWNRVLGWRARLADRLAGKLTHWNVQTSYAQSKRALELANLVIALGDAERDAIISGFQINPGKIQVFPNGINPHFFTANGDLFRRETGIAGPFVLMVGAISPYKNQLGLARALADLDLPIVLIGASKRDDLNYLEELLRVPKVNWLGVLEHADPLLASAFNAAAVVALPSQGEVFPLAVLEALAAGTPVVMTDESALNLPAAGFALKKVRWDDAVGQRGAICALLAARPEPGAVRALVAQFTWERVAAHIAHSYFSLAKGKHHAV
ncbi:glycosyltransferase involved in cell wall biosynthesis [Oxalobacteraceae bacterium GrIS 1.11]